MSNFIKYGDYLQINTVMGRTKHIKLNRTYYEIVSQNLINEQKVEATSYTIVLPNITRPFHYILECNSDQNYIFYAKDATHFNINGSYSYRSTISSFDKIKIEYNLLSFITEKTHTDHSTSLEQDNSMSNIDFSNSEITILLVGETGTGKSTKARKIHEMHKKIGPFIHVNLSSFAPSLIESELFGHVKGAFTGATNDKRGAFLDANEGTLFLDEIDSLPLEIQVKLLLFFDNFTIRPVGSNCEKKIRTSVIIASGTPLERLLEEKRIRQDFYFRITSGFQIKLKPLRESPEQIEEICQNFCLKENIMISHKLIEFYKQQKWPGNIRQLIAHLKKKKLLAHHSSKIDLDSHDLELNSNIVKNQNLFHHLKSLEEFKKDYIQKVFYDCDGNHHDCLKILDISYNTLKRYVSV
ncbi:MAG: sigma 54-interacting transcriptional regulator [Bacteriovoracaceae bacterium]